MFMLADIERKPHRMTLRMVQHCTVAVVSTFVKKDLL